MRHKYSLFAFVCFCLLLCLAKGYSLARSFIVRTSEIEGVINHEYYKERLEYFKAMSREEGQIIFLGDSITELVKFDELLPSMDIINRGILGDTTAGVLNRLDEIISLRPRKLFLLIGTNDMGLTYGLMLNKIAGNIRQIVLRLKEGTPETKIYLQGLFPRYSRSGFLKLMIRWLNSKLKTIAEETGCTYIDLYPLLLVDGELGKEYSPDNLHLTILGMTKWMEFLKPYLDE